MSELVPSLVSRRLAELREIYTPMTREEALRLMAPRPREASSFEELVQKRLDELRALSELTRHLHRRH